MTEIKQGIGSVDLRQPQLLTPGCPAGFARALSHIFGLIAVVSTASVAIAREPARWLGNWEFGMNC
jgi:hypothetical protein